LRLNPKLNPLKSKIAREGERVRETRRWGKRSTSRALGGGAKGAHQSLLRNIKSDLRRAHSLGAVAFALQHTRQYTRHATHLGLDTPHATYVGNTNMCCNTSCRHPIRDTRCSTRDNTQMCCNTCVATHLGNTQFATHTALHVDVTHCATCHQRTPFICSFLHHNMLK